MIKLNNGIFGSGAAGLSQGDVADLLKSMEIGHDRPRSTGGGVMVREWLDGVMASTLFDAQDYVRFYSMLPKEQVTSNIVEFNQHTSRGGRETPMALAESGDIMTTSSTWARQHANIKYVATKGAISDVAMTVTADSPLLQAETQDRTDQLLTGIEDLLFYASASIDAYEWDGLIQTVETNAAANIYDAAGAILTRDMLMNGTQTIHEQQRGRIKQWLMAPSVMMDYSHNVLAYRRAQLGAGADDNGTVDSLVTNFGRAEFKDCVALRPWQTTDALASASGDSADQPATPALTSGPTASGSGSSFAAADAGDYIYKIRAFGAKGYSAALTSSAVTVAAGEQVDFVITDPVSGADVRYYVIYRTPVDGVAATAVRIARVTKGGTTTAFTDTNAYRPNTSWVFGLEIDKRNMYMAELGSVLRIPYGRVSMQQVFALLKFGTPIFKVPTKIWAIKNVGITTV